MAVPSPVSRREFLAIGAAVGLTPYLDRWQAIRRPVPSTAQLLWQRDELALLVYFGMNTFTNREEGSGTESPGLFNPTAFDARQWTRAARSAGFRSVMLTAKHRDGFCLWPTATTCHSVASSPFRGGDGDVVRELADACRADGLRLGIGLSAWDRNAETHGTDRYDDFLVEQLTELLSNYGPIQEVWFDGTSAAGPSGRRPVYDWARYSGVVRRLQPDAVISSEAGPDVRTVAAMGGGAGDTTWSTVDPAAVPSPGVVGAAVERMLRSGDPAGGSWRPAETRASIRPGWFWHPAENAMVRPVAELVALHDGSVGRNGKLLLAAPATGAGLLPEPDLARLAGMRQALAARTARNLALGRPTTWRSEGARGGEVVVNLGRPTPVSLVVLEEDIARGQVISGWRLEGDRAGAWQPITAGTTIGNKRIIRAGGQYQRLRVTITDALAAPARVDIGVY